MSFNSKEFPLFFLLIVLAYFLTPYRHRWKLLLAGSYLFYMAWKPEYASWLIVLTLIDYFCALRMGARRTKEGRLPWLLVSVGANLLLLIGFKYAGFLSETLRSVCGALGIAYGTHAFQVLLPLGISFHTLQTIGYSIDVYRGVKEPEKHLGLFALYVSFFPQLVAGPIERSTTLLPQFRKHFDFKYVRVVEGLRLMLWGLFKKIVIADRLALYVDAVYGNPLAFGAAPTALATLFFAFQIYCDFSGYSDIAIGTAKVLGYNLTINFNRPYVARSIREFWRRWHISLSSWFRDYVYVPLGGNRVSTAAWVLIILLVFLLSGLWHGANWTFCVWGLIHGTYYMVSRVTARTRGALRDFAGISPDSRLLRAASILLTFLSVCFAWVFFRAASLSDAMQLVSNLARFRGVQGAQTGVLINSLFGYKGLALDCMLIVFLLVTEAVVKEQRIEKYWSARPLVWRWGAAYLIIFAMIILGNLGRNEFIYFQF
ncbi:MAG TPA: MBOAT family O-acyltransferase [Blastocatellia bacterium]|jgi:D-alanyl-lipoteichoic acid acyltransferase DltB (MBOAT superfamily)